MIFWLYSQNCTAIVSVWPEYAFASNFKIVVFVVWEFSKTELIWIPPCVSVVIFECSLPFPTFKWLTLFSSRNSTVDVCRGLSGLYKGHHTNCIFATSKVTIWIFILCHTFFSFFFFMYFIPTRCAFWV